MNAKQKLQVSDPTAETSLKELMTIWTPLADASNAISRINEVNSSGTGPVSEFFRYVDNKLNSALKTLEKRIDEINGVG